MSLSSSRFVVVIPLTAGVFAAEMATPNDDKDDDFPTIEEVLYTASQEKGLGHVRKPCSAARMVNASPGEMEEAASNQTGDAICNGTLVPGDSVGNTPGEHLSSFPGGGEQD